MEAKYILHKFPLLNSSNFRITSPITTFYNCIAWAAEDTTRAWWPSAYWPPDAPRETTVDAFEEAFGTLGYEKCDNADLEKGYLKVALYMNIGDGRPTHAARQLANGKWTSKLGPQHDIEHETPNSLCGSEYGTIVSYMKKRVS